MCCWSCHGHHELNQKISDWIFAREQTGVVERSYQKVRDWLYPRKRPRDPSQLSRAFVISLRMATVGIAFFSVTCTGAGLYVIGKGMEDDKHKPTGSRLVGTALKCSGYLLMELPSFLLRPRCENWHCFPCRHRYTCW